MCKTSGRLSWHPGCAACNNVVTVSEQNRAEQRGGHLCVHGLCCFVKKSVWLSMYGCECERVCIYVCVCIHVWLNTAGHQQLWQASAVVRDECCHSQVTPDHSQNDLLSSHFPSSSSPTSSALPVNRTWRYSSLLGLIGHENTQGCYDLSTISTAKHTRGLCVPLL